MFKEFNPEDIIHDKRHAVEPGGQLQITKCSSLPNNLTERKFFEKNKSYTFNLKTRHNM